MDPNFQLTFTRIARLIVYFVYLVVVAVLILLVLGFFFRLAGASDDASFVEWVYRNVERAMEPFRGMFPEEQLGDGTSVFDASLLFGIAFYAILAIVLHAIIEWITHQVLMQHRRVDEVHRQEMVSEREADLTRREQRLTDRERQSELAYSAGGPSAQQIPPSPAPVPPQGAPTQPPQAPPPPQPPQA
jgi:uncharacterized protein YggT (Ycf19 family)